MPGAKALSTVEWHSAQVMPTRVSVSFPFTVSTVPFTPKTASSLSRARVVAGSVRLMVPFWMPVTTAGGSASESTLSPTWRAVVGSTVADHLVHPKRVGPLRLVAEGVVAEGLLPLRELRCIGSVVAAAAERHEQKCAAPAEEGLRPRISTVGRRGEQG